MRKILLLLVAVFLLALPMNADVCTVVNPAGCTGNDIPDAESPQVTTQDSNDNEDVCTVVNPAGCTGALFLNSYFNPAPRFTTMDVCTVVNPAGCTGEMLFWQAYFGLSPQQSAATTQDDDNEDVCTVVNPAGCT